MLINVGPVDEQVLNIGMFDLGTCVQAMRSAMLEDCLKSALELGALRIDPLFEGQEANFSYLGHVCWSEVSAIMVGEVMWTVVRSCMLNLGVYIGFQLMVILAK
jgi:hypothetical protein